MATLSIVGLVLSLALIVILALKGFHIIFIAPLATVVVALFSNMDVMKTLTGPYMTGFINYAGKFYLLFLAASIFGKFMEDSGAARSIALGIIKLIGRESQYKVMLAVAAISFVLTLGGVNLFVVIFAVLPIARPLFKEMDIPWHLFIAPFIFGAASLTMTMIPGSPSILNIMPTKYLGTTPTAAPLMGIIGALILASINFWYMNYALKKALKNGEVYSTTGETGAKAVETDLTGKLPNVWLSILPPVVLIVLLNVMKLDVVWSLLTGSGLCIVLFWKQFTNILDTLNKGALNTVVPIINTCADVGYGMAVAATAGFKVISGALLTLPGSPIISLALATNLMAAITGSASGGLGIILETLTSKYVALGLNPELIHRVVAMSAGCFDALPHNGVVITTLAVAGLTHATGYKHIWWGHVVGTLVTLIIAIPFGILIYG